ncbi:MAG: hypothetical protein HY751_11025 [Nitrospinae bacterium]|nr:hypothetical protein [Nitrospinota bacterium]
MEKLKSPAKPFDDEEWNGKLSLLFVLTPVAVAFGIKSAILLLISYYL